MKTKSTSILAAGLFAASALSAQVAFLDNPNPNPGDRGIFAFWNFDTITTADEMTTANVNSNVSNFGDISMDGSQFGPIPGAPDPFTNQWTFLWFSGFESTDINLPPGQDNAGSFRVENSGYPDEDFEGTFFEFAFSMEGLEDLRIDLAMTSNEDVWQWSYSTDGVNYTDFGPLQEVTSGSDFSLAPGASTNALDGVEDAYLRFTSVSYGIQDIDNLTFTATAVPEPAAYGLLVSLATLGLVLSRRRSRV